MAIVSKEASKLRKKALDEINDSKCSDEHKEILEDMVSHVDDLQKLVKAKLGIDTALYPDLTLRTPARPRVQFYSEDLSKLANSVIDKLMFKSIHLITTDGYLVSDSANQKGLVYVHFHFDYSFKSGGSNGSEVPGSWFAWDIKNKKYIQV